MPTILAEITKDETGALAVETGAAVKLPEVMELGAISIAPSSHSTGTVGARRSQAWDSILVSLTAASPYPIGPRMPITGIKNGVELPMLFADNALGEGYRKATVAEFRAYCKRFFTSAEPYLRTRAEQDATGRWYVDAYRSPSVRGKKGGKSRAHANVLALAFGVSE